MTRYTDGLTAEGLIRYLASDPLELSFDKAHAQHREAKQACIDWLAKRHMQGGSSPIISKRCRELLAEYDQAPADALATRFPDEDLGQPSRDRRVVLQAMRIATLEGRLGLLDEEGRLLERKMAPEYLGLREDF